MGKILSPIKQRIIQFIENAGVVKESFYDEAGISSSNFKGPGLYSEIGGDKIAKILSLFPEINSEWLLTGKGNMRKEYSLTNLPVNAVNDNGKGIVKTPVKSRITKRPADKGLIKFYDTDFAAGDIFFYDDTAAIKPAYEMDIPEFAGCTAFRTYNNSMEKLIYSGDILFATKEEDWQNSLEYGQIYGIVRNDGRKYLKYVRKHPEQDKTHFLLKSENAAEYDDFTIAKEKIKSIWLIHGWLKKRAG